MPRPMPRPRPALLALTLALLLLTACDEQAEMPLSADPKPSADDTQLSQLEVQRAAAPTVLGLTEDEVEAKDLPSAWRVSRRGDQQVPLTRDYRVGRLTLELDDDGTGVMRVTKVTIELPDGQVSFT